MRPKLFPVAATASLLFCARMTVLWARSYRIADSIVFRQAKPSDVISWGEPTVFRRWVRLESGDGVLFLSYNTFTTRYDLAAADEGDETFQMKPRLWWYADRSGLWYNNINHLRPLPTFWQRVGFHLDDDAPFATEEGHIVGVPLWLVALIAAVLPSKAAFHAIRCSRRDSHLRCRHCGYDLRATPERCPECGKVPESATP